MSLLQYKERYYAGNDRMNPVLENKLKSKSTAVSNNPAFPTSDANGDDYNFEELIAYKRFLDCVERVKRYSGMTDISSPQSFATLQQKMFGALMKVKDIEKPNKDNLEKLSVDLVKNEMELPSNAFDFNSKIVEIGSVTAEKFQSRSKEPSQNEIQNAFGEKAMEEFMSANQLFELEKYKRRFINMLIQGSSKKGHYMFELIREDLNKLNPELANYYGLIMAVNDYSYWVIPESYIEQNFDNPQSMAGREEIDNSGEKPKIKTQGINFPVLVHENIKGVMDIFGTHGLPDDEKEQQMVMDSTDTLYNEIWDIRLGVVVWEKFVSSYPFEVFEIGNRNMQHYIFMRFCQLPADEFFSVARNILSDNPKGKKFMEDLLKDIVQDMNKSSLEDVFGSDDDYNDYEEFNKGGKVKKSVKNDEYDVYDNSRMIKNQANEIEHHSEELNKQVSITRKIPSWVIAKMERASTDLSDVTHYLDGERKFQYGGSISDEIDYLDRRINSLKEDLSIRNEEDIPQLQQTINDLEREKKYLENKNENVEQSDNKKRFFFFKNGGNVGRYKYDVIPFPKSDKYVVMTTIYDDGRDAFVKDVIRDFKGSPMKFNSIKSAEKYADNIKFKHPFGMVQKARYGAILVASQLFQNRQNQKPETQYVYYIPKSEEYQQTEIVQEIPQMRTGGELTQKDLNDFCVSEIIELCNEIQDVSFYKTIRHDSNDEESKKWNGKLVLVFKNDVEERTLNAINEFILRAEPCQEILDQKVHFSTDRPKLISIYFRTNNYTDIEYKLGGKVYENTPKKINLSKTDIITTSLGDYVLNLITNDFVYFVNKYEGDENAQVIMYNKKGELVSDNYFATSNMYEVLESEDEFEYIHPDLIEYKNEFN